LVTLVLLALPVSPAFTAASGTNQLFTSLEVSTSPGDQVGMDMAFS
jgi:hypothetical protein